MINIAKAYDLTIKLPGLAQENVQFVDYIQTIFTLMISIAGIAALLMIMFGGFQYITAGGNESRTGQAKDRIKNAILGLILALCSWLVLNTINPDLVAINLPGLNTIKEAEDFDIITIPKPGDGKASQGIGMPCLIPKDCFYDLKCILDKTEYHCPTDRKVFNSREECEKRENQKFVNCELPPGGSCNEVEIKTCHEQDVGGKKKIGQLCSDTTQEEPWGDCFDQRLVCRPFDATGIKHCLKPSSDICEENSDCDQTLGAKLICKNKQCQTETGKTIEPEDSPKTDPFAHSPTEKLDEKYYVFVPDIYQWTESGNKCDGKWTKPDQNTNTACLYYFDTPQGQDRETIECSQDKNECTIYRLAIKKQNTDINDSPLFLPSGEPDWKNKSCEHLGETWGEAERTMCEAMIDPATEDSLCCKNTNTILCCRTQGQVSHAQKEWKTKGRFKWDDDCRTALKKHYEELEKEFGYIPGYCWYQNK